MCEIKQKYFLRANNNYISQQTQKKNIKKLMHSLKNCKRDEKQLMCQ